MLCKFDGREKRQVSEDRETSNLVYAGVLESCLEKLITSCEEEHFNPNLEELFERLMFVRERLSGSFSCLSASETSRVYEERIRRLQEEVDNLLVEGKLEVQGVFTAEVYRENGEWWEDRRGRADLRLPLDLSKAIDRVTENTDFTMVIVYYDVDSTSKKLKFDRVEVNGKDVPDLIGELFWKFWEEDIKALHSKSF